MAGNRLGSEKLERSFILRRSQNINLSVGGRGIQLHYAGIWVCGETMGAHDTVRLLPNPAGLSSEAVKQYRRCSNDNQTTYIYKGYSLRKGGYT